MHKPAVGVSPGVQEELEMPLATLGGAPETGKALQCAPALPSYTKTIKAGIFRDALTSRCWRTGCFFSGIRS